MPQPREPNPNITILCPLAIEARAARKALRAFKSHTITVTTTGPGQPSTKAAVERAVATAAANGNPRPTLILFGTAGGLRDTVLSPPITTIIDAQSPTTRRHPPMIAAGHASSKATLLSVATPVFTKEAKRRAAEEFEAELVDCESAAFAEACEDMGIRWGIVRGVSDAWDEELPVQCQHWITPEGTTRVRVVFFDCLKAPHIIAKIIRLGLNSDRALDAAARQLLSMIRAESTPAA